RAHRCVAARPGAGADALAPGAGRTEARSRRLRQPLRARHRAGRRVAAGHGHRRKPGLPELPAAARRGATRSRRARRRLVSPRRRLTPVETPLRQFFARAFARLDSLIGRGPVVATGLLVLFGLALAALAFGFVNPAAPTSLTIASGPDGSTFR